MRGSPPVSRRPGDERGLDSPLAGSTTVPVTFPSGDETHVDGYGTLTAKPLSVTEVEAAAREFPEREFRDDAPGLMTTWRRTKGTCR